MRLLLLIVCAAVLPASEASAALTIRESVFDLTTGGTATSLGSIFGESGAGFTVVGDTYGIDALVQDSQSAFFLSSTPQLVHTFGPAPSPAGDNLGQAAGVTLVVTGMQTDLGGGQFLIQAEITSVDAANNPTPWIAAGQMSPNNECLRTGASISAILQPPRTSLLQTCRGR